MTWTRLPDDYADRMALAQLDVYGMALDVQLLVWCNRLLTDGFVPKSMVASAAPLLFSDEVPETMAELVKAGFWTEVEGGWQRDWSQQEPAERVKARQEANRERQATFRDRTTRCRAGDHSLCDRCEAVRTGKATGRNGVTNGVRNGVSNTPPSRPDPTLREGREEGRPSATPSALGAPPATPRDDDEDDWIIPKGAPGYFAQCDRGNKAFLSWMNMQPDEKVKGNSTAERARLWRLGADWTPNGDAPSWEQFRKSELKSMREAGGREKWLASQKGS